VDDGNSRCNSCTEGNGIEQLWWQQLRTMATVATALVTITLVALTIVPFITRHVVANAIARVVGVAIAFVSVQQ
jgi:hypothetical protein